MTTLTASSQLTDGCDVAMAQSYRPAYPHLHSGCCPRGGERGRVCVVLGTPTRSSGPTALHQHLPGVAAGSRETVGGRGAAPPPRPGRGRQSPLLRAQPGALSETLRLREDGGQIPGALGRADIEALLNRLAYQQNAGTLTHPSRVMTCRHLAADPARICAIGLTRPGAPAAGLPDDFAVSTSDIPYLPDRAEPSLGTCHRRSCGSRAASSPPWNASTASISAPSSSWSSTPGGGPMRSPRRPGTA